MKGIRVERTSDIQEVQVLGGWAYLRNYIDMTAPAGLAHLAPSLTMCRLHFG
jgi:hypothetical protein